MSYIPVRSGKRNHNWFIELETGFNSFLDNADWLYNFEEENPQPKKQHFEARYLSQYFFSRLIQSIDPNYSVKITDDVYMEFKRNDEKTIFHFDVMNNPKEAHAFGKSIKQYSLDEWKIWKGRYHTIGNLTPVPWPCLEYGGSINMQNIHGSFDERWDLFLKFCQSEWASFKGVHIDFYEYMKLTCQDIYFEVIYDSFKKEFRDCNIERVTDEKLLEWYSSIDCVKLKKMQIISFGNNMENDVKNINQLILIRSKLMRAIISSKLQYKNTQKVENLEI